MRYLALAFDYDGTLAHDGRVAPKTIDALKKAIKAGRKLLLVTGRELGDLVTIFGDHLVLFDRVVAENGALLYRPISKEQLELTVPPEQALVKALAAKGVEPLSVGQSIIATTTPHETTVIETIKELGLELQVTFNKGAVMILPSAVNKATGLLVALNELGLSPHNVAGIGDGENDHAFLSSCECSFAVANAIPTLRERADMVTDENDGAGVIQLIEQVLADDLAELDQRLIRHQLPLGINTRNKEVAISPYGTNVLIAGPSGSGKSTYATGFIERVHERGYQFCIIDPEGDYENFEGAVVLGDNKNAPPESEVMRLLENPRQNVVVNLVGMKLEDRPKLFASLLARLQEMRLRTGRPHWLIIDEAHHLMPAAWEPALEEITNQAHGMLFITVHPDWMSPGVLASVDVMIAVGKMPAQTLKGFSTGLRQHALRSYPRWKDGEVIAWLWKQHKPPLKLRIIPNHTERLRHRRKYAEGDLGENMSFYFRGPRKALSRRAQNLIQFMQLGEGVDKDTWDFHLHRGDYTTWFRDVIKNPDLADEAEQVAKNKSLPAKESRAKIRTAIENRYTMPERPV